MKQSIPFAFVLILFSACSPRITYLGDTYGSTAYVDVFYDERDVERDFRVIGLARNEGDDLERDDMESIRKEMIKKAREVGADAILFLRIGENRENEIDWESKKIVEAKFLKYQGD